MTIKAIVCDMDGTLLTSEHKIAQRTLQKLIELQKDGVKLILASGRSYVRMLPDALKLHMDRFGGLIIDVNGTSIYDVQAAKRQRIGSMERANIEELNAFFSIFDVELQYTQDDTIYTYLPDSIYNLKRNIRGEMRLPEDYPWTGGMYSWLCDTRDGYPNQHMVRDLAATPASCNKVSIVQEPAYIAFVRQSLVNHPIYERYEFVFSDERKMEVTQKGITKGKALDLLLEKYRIQNDEVAVFGDSENDLSMFHEKKYSVAMANALPAAKEKANYMTESHNHDGIYNMLTRMEAKDLL